MGRSRYKITDPKLPHFVTCTVLHWIPVFTRPATVDILLDSLRFLMTESLTVYAYVILENHLHLLVQSEQLDRDMARLLSFPRSCVGMHTHLIYSTVCIPTEDGGNEKRMAYYTYKFDMDSQGGSWEPEYCN